MLRGNAETKIDEKGRLKLPADFKKVFDLEFPETKFYITSMDGKTARIYPMEEWLKVEEKLGKGSFNSITSELKFKVNYFGGEAEIDSQNRLLIPQVLREKAGIKGEVSVMGMMNFLEVCTSQFATERAEREFTAAQLEAINQMEI